MKIDLGAYSFVPDDLLQSFDSELRTRQFFGSDLTKLLANQGITYAQEMTRTSDLRFRSAWPLHPFT